MNCKLYKVRFNYKDKKGVERYGFNYYLVFENGTKIRIEPNSWKDDKGNFHTSVDKLDCMAQLIESI